MPFTPQGPDWDAIRRANRHTAWAFIALAIGIGFALFLASRPI